MNLRVDVLEDYAALAALREPWAQLCRSCHGTAFQRPAWLLAWIRQFGPLRPLIVAVYRSESGAEPGAEPGAEQLVGLAPMFFYDRPNAHGHGRTTRTLALLGAGVSDYLDVMISPGLEPEVLAAILDTLSSRRERWDVCELDQLRTAESPLLRTPLPPSWSQRTIARTPCPVLALPLQVDALAARVPTSHWRRYLYYQRRARQVGRLRLERATPHSYERLLDALIHLHQARWRGRGELGEFADARREALHREVAAGFVADDALALYALQLDDRPIACVLGFEAGPSVYYYTGGFDPAFARLSPGVVALGMVLEASIQRGFTRFDFLRGGEPYKYWWGAVDHDAVRVELTYDST